ncbi:MAG: hypothetical protein IIB31_08975 [Chloroflexi bacterium]|nr:hypothetical protein [Chloroflexota bacterium]
MPITKRQFQLGIGEDIQRQMREIYTLLGNERESAYSSEELQGTFLGDTHASDARVNLDRALDVLVEIGAVDKRLVAEIPYYAFHQKFDTDSWERDFGV